MQLTTINPISKTNSIIKELEKLSLSKVKKLSQEEVDIYVEDLTKLENAIFTLQKARTVSFKRGFPAIDELYDLSKSLGKWADKQNAPANDQVEGKNVCGYKQCDGSGLIIGVGVKSPYTGYKYAFWCDCEQNVKNGQYWSKIEPNGYFKRSEIDLNRVRDIFECRN